jgi:hypothetical protein
MTAPLEHRESADQYRAVIVCQCRHRVILCKDSIQWIMQRRGKLAGARWRAIGYFTTRAALARVWAACQGTVPPEIARLPDTVRGRANG